MEIGHSMDGARGLSARSRAIGGLAAVCAVLSMTSPAAAQFYPSPPLSSAHVSSQSALFDLTTRFLRQLGTEAGNLNAGPPLVSNPNGGGAELALNPQDQRRWRAWFEGYGLWSRMSGQGTFPGDRRETFGGVAGLGYTAAPGISFGASVDQSHTKIEIADLPQRARLDLTQIGTNAAFESGPWTLAVAAIYGFGRVHTERDDFGGTVDHADYDASMWGTLAELSYLWTSGAFRIVPKAGADWARVRTDSFVESGGPTATTGSDQVSTRTRLFAGAEFGNTWNFDKALFDLSAYGRLVGIVQQDIGTLQVGGGVVTVPVQGVGESRLGADAGAAATWRLSSLMRIYAAYDGRFRSNFTSHAGTLGLELRW
ncbi:MAG TPA: autotransporter outer membrane beta-barrel domain-containing protein [Pseudorhodoplanes sp.]|nr:autotransporter outer membrane beta-barrel domain-containing protein [Pseudorhodoplanes sp.]